MAMRLKQHVPLLESSMRRAFVPSVASSLCTRCRRHASSAAYPENIAVLGAGISGLASAYFVAKEYPKSRITVYEAGQRPGGWVSSKRVRAPGGDVLFEYGPRTLRATDAKVTTKLIQDLGLATDLITTDKEAPGAKNRYIYYPDRLNRMPPPLDLANNLKLFSSGVLNGFQSLILEFFRPPRSSSLRDESIGSFISRRLDKRIVQRVFSGVMHGIYAGDIWKLSARTLLSQAWQMETRGNGVFDGFITLQSRDRPGVTTLAPPHWLEVQEAKREEIKLDPALSTSLRKCAVFTLKDGLQQLTDALHKNLVKNPQVQVMLGRPVQSYTMASDGQQRVEVTAGHGRHQTTQNFDLVISTLREPSLTPFVTVMTVNLYYSTPNLNSVPGFGYLIPQGVPFENNPERALGVIFDSDAVKGQDTAEGTKFTVMLGGHYWDGWQAYPNSEEGIALAKSLLKRHLGITQEPDVTNVGLWKDCIPQYTVGYEDRLRDHVANVRNKFQGRVRLVGAQYNGVSVNNCVEQAWMTARGLRGNGWKEKATGLETRVSEQQWIPVVGSRRVTTE